MLAQFLTLNLLRFQISFHTCYILHGRPRIHCQGHAKDFGAELNIPPFMEGSLLMKFKRDDEWPQSLSMWRGLLEGLKPQYLFHIPFQSDHLCMSNFKPAFVSRDSWLHGPFSRNMPLQTSHQTSSGMVCFSNGSLLLLKYQPQ